MNTRETACTRCGKPVYYLPVPTIGAGRFVRCPHCRHELVGVVGQGVPTNVQITDEDEKR